MKVLYLDESGDHNLSVIDPQFPVFVLGGVIVDQDYAEGPLTKALNSFKQEMFGTTEIVLHTADIARNRNGFEALKNRAFRERFYARLNELMFRLDYKVVACAVLKEEYVHRYGNLAKDPYVLGLEEIAQVFRFEIGNVHHGGIIVAERRSEHLDSRLIASWSSLVTLGAQSIRARSVAQRIERLELRTKDENLSGLQLADLVVTPIARHILGKTDYEDWRIIEGKIREDRRGMTGGYGLKVLPEMK